MFPDDSVTTRAGRSAQSRYVEVSDTLSASRSGKINGETTLRIVRLNGDLLAIEGAALSEAFFAQDPSSLGDASSSYDSLAGRTSIDTIEASDIEVLNRTTRARTTHGRWAPIMGTRPSWLKEIDPDLDLIEFGCTVGRR